MILEGVADKRSPAHIAVDNIQIMDGLAADECTGAGQQAPPPPPTEGLILRKYRRHARRC